MEILLSFIGILLPFIGTSIGSGFVFFLKNKINDKLNKLLIGFAIGVMLAASIWSLILPSLELAGSNWFHTIIGLVSGFLFLIITDILANKIKSSKKINMLVFSVTLHNIPEGMAVGVCFAGFLALSTSISLIDAFLLSIGIAIQNIPEGAIISMPLRNKGKIKSFVYGVLSGIVEPIAAFITIILLNIVVPLLPFLLSFASGAMIYVIIEELIPEMNESKHSYYGIIGVMIGFILMMILDISMG